MENEAEEELITAMDIGSDSDLTLVDTHERFRAAQRQIRYGRKTRKLTGKSWEEKVEEGTRRRYYYNTDTKETSWERPTIIDAYAELLHALKKGWSCLVNTVLVRVLRFLLPAPDRLQCALVCRNWRKACQSPYLCLWVNSAQRSLAFDEVITVGNRVECLFESGEVWYPAVVTDVLPNGTYVVTYTDGVEEANVQREFLRLDRGLRYAMRHEEGSPPIGVLNKHLCSNFGCGPRLVDPILCTTLQEAMDRAVDGDTIVLTTGVHAVASATVPEVSLKIIGEHTFVTATGRYELAYELTWGMQAEAVQLELERKKLNLAEDSKLRLLNRTVHTLDKDLLNVDHPCHNIDIIGLETETLRKAAEHVVPTVCPLSTESKPYPCPQRSCLTLSKCHVMIEGAATSLSMHGVGIYQGSQGDTPISSGGHCLEVTGGKCVMLEECTLSNMHGSGACVFVSSWGTLVWLSKCHVYNSPCSGVAMSEGKLICVDSELSANAYAGVVVNMGAFLLKRCKIHANSSAGVSLKGPPGWIKGKILECDVKLSPVSLDADEEFYKDLKVKRTSFDMEPDVESAEEATSTDEEEDKEEDKEEEVEVPKKRRRPPQRTKGKGGGNARKKRRKRR